MVYFILLVFLSVSTFLRCLTTLLVPYRSTKLDQVCSLLLSSVVLFKRNYLKHCAIYYLNVIRVVLIFNMLVKYSIKSVPIFILKNRPKGFDKIWGRNSPQGYLQHGLNSVSFKIVVRIVYAPKPLVHCLT